MGPTLSRSPTKRFHDYKTNPDTRRRTRGENGLNITPHLTFFRSNLQKADISLNFSLPGSHISRRLDVRPARCWRQRALSGKPSEDFPMLARAPPPFGKTLKVAVSGVRAFIRRECGRVDVAVSLAPCSPSSISAALWHISLPTRSFRFAWQME